MGEHDTGAGGPSSAFPELTGPDDPRVASRIVRLEGGRAVSFSELGDPSGFPVVNCHGGLVGRLDILVADPVARELGIWLISPDRPGLGASDPQPGRTVGSWADDVAGLADRLGLERFGVVGWSLGGAYAAACAAAPVLADRLTAVALVGATLPIDEPTTFAVLNSMDQRLVKLSGSHPGRARRVFSAMGALARRAPGVWRRSSARSLGDPDAAVLLREPASAWSLASAEALSSPGMVDEYAVWAAPWGFDYADTTVPVHLWQGDQDPLVPVAWAHELAERIPGSDLHVLPGVGHFLLHDHAAEVLGPLRP